jgi:hypothetical protein
LLPLHLNEVKDCWHGWDVVVRLYRLQTMCFWWRIMDLVEPQCMGNTIDLWLRDVWMICNLWHGYDGAGTAGFARPHCTALSGPILCSVIGFVRPDRDVAPREW